VLGAAAGALVCSLLRARGREVLATGDRAPAS
jgi:hypothetical protein